ncbi:hypothetical protein GCM10027562_29120 [Arthrobacter pigmenti]
MTFGCQQRVVAQHLDADTAGDFACFLPADTIGDAKHRIGDQQRIFIEITPACSEAQPHASAIDTAGDAEASNALTIARMRSTT